MNKKQKYKYYLNETRHNFLLDTFFPDNTGTYEEKEVGEYWLIKQRDNDKNRWQVAIYTAEKYKVKKSTQT
jgi:hypothetical protein